MKQLLAYITIGCNQAGIVSVRFTSTCNWQVIIMGTCISWLNFMPALEVIVIILRSVMDSEQTKKSKNDERVGRLNGCPLSSPGEGIVQRHSNSNQRAQGYDRFA
jgi:hypothetical protein